MPQDIMLALSVLGVSGFSLGGVSVGAGLAPIGSHAFQHMSSDPCPPPTRVSLPYTELYKKSLHA